MHRHVEGQALVLVAEQVGSQNQVGGAGDGQELGEPLHQGQDDDLQDFHERGRVEAAREYNS